MPKAFKSCLKSNKSPDLVTLVIRKRERLKSVCYSENERVTIREMEILELRERVGSNRDILIIITETY